MSMEIPQHMLEELITQGIIDLAGETLVVKDGEGNEVTVRIEEGTLELDDAIHTK